MKKGENAIFPLLKDSLSECKYNLKMHRSLKKTHLLWFAMGWNSHQFSRKHFLLYKGEYWFREDCQFSPYVLLHRETYICHFVSRQAWPLLSHLLGRWKRGAGSSLTSKPPLPPLQAAVFDSHVTPPDPAESIKLITLLCLSPGLGSPSSALSGHPLFSLSCVTS